MDVVDSHIHLCEARHPWLAAVEQEQGLQTGALDKLWSCEELCAQVAACAANFSVRRAVFVEACGGVHASAETALMLREAARPDGLVAACVAHVPAPDGAAAVNAFLDGLRDSAGAGRSGTRPPPSRRGDRTRRGETLPRRDGPAQARCRPRSRAAASF